MTTVVEVHLYACGAPKRSMGWYHASQLLDGRFKDVKLTNVVEPFFMSNDEGSIFSDFRDWRAIAESKGVSFHKSVEESPDAGAHSVALICGRTCDNPKLFEAAVAKKFKSIILEKPGAPNFEALVELAALAKENGVSVYMGYNRNFSRYVTKLVERAKLEEARGADIAVTLGRKDCFAEDALDDCFERNAEGMLANMMCHELMVLVTYFSLTAAAIKSVVVNQSYHTKETRRGLTDFRQMGFTIVTQTNKKFTLWGDRCGGEYCEAIITTAGSELFKALRPDMELRATIDRLEQAMPGCQPYFYLQDGEYFELKQAVFQHIQAGAAGVPPGIANIDMAVENMAVIKKVQEALLAPLPALLAQHKTLVTGPKVRAPAESTELGQGNLVQFEDTWHVAEDLDTIPCDATWSLDSIKAGPSEYAEGSSGYQAWSSKSMISFEYRVVEVPSGSLLDPACDALVFGHLEPGSQARKEAYAKPQRRLIVIDQKVHDLYGDQVRTYFQERGVVHELLVLDTCEENKSWELTSAVCAKMKKFNIDRRLEPVIAIGGGVCLDVVGLAASLFRRRTPYIRVPTTALSYVDASVGAKNGCNFLGSKNRLGTYVPPCAALLDSSFFQSQGERDIANSLAEMIKMAIMKSAELLDLIEQNGPRLIASKFKADNASDTAPAKILRISIQTMMEELTPNLWESCLDRLVDFGHGLGQDLEMTALGTEHELMHGEAIACDMSFMTVLSHALGNLTAEDRDRILHMIHTCNLPTWHPAFTREFFQEALAARIKNSLGMRLPLPVGIGKARMFNDVTDSQFEAAFVQWESLCKDTSVRVCRPA